MKQDRAPVSRPDQIGAMPEMLTTRNTTPALADQFGVSYIDARSQVVQLDPSPAGIVHDMLFVGDKLFATFRGDPAYFVRFNDLDDLSDYDVLNNFPVDSETGATLYNHCDVMAYSKKKNTIYAYCMTNDGEFGVVGTHVIAIDPDSLAYTTAVLDVDYDSGESPGMCCSDDHLYIVTSGNDSKVLVYDLNTFARVAAISLAITGTNLSLGHAMAWDGHYAYASGYGEGPGWIAKIDPSNFTATCAYLATEDQTPTDDIAVVGDYVYQGLEGNVSGGGGRGNVVVTKTSDLSIYKYIATGVNAAIDCVRYSGDYIMVTLRTNPGTICLIDPQTFESYLFTLGATTDHTDEVVFDGARFIAGSEFGKFTRCTMPFMSRSALALGDGVVAPIANTGIAYIYVDGADGDLKVMFGDGTVKTLATDT